MSSLFRAVFVAVLATIALVVMGTAGPTQADESSETSAVTVTFQQPVAREGNRISIAVRLATSGGEPVTRQPVEFFVTPDFIGERPVFIVAALTNKDGIASITYEPTWDGEHRMTARYAGSHTYQPAEAASVLQLTGVPPIEIPTEEHLNLLRQWAAPGAIAVVLTVWLLLAGVAFRVGWGIIRAGNRGGFQHIPAYDTVVATAPERAYSPHVRSDVGSRTGHRSSALSTADDSGQSDT